MKLHFSIEYLTHWGEDVRVSLTLVDAKGRTQTQTYPMETRDGHRWTGEVLITDGRIRSFHYHYSVYKEGRKFRTDGTSYLAVSGPTLLNLFVPGRLAGCPPFVSSLYFRFYAVRSSAYGRDGRTAIFQQYVDVEGECSSA